MVSIILPAYNEDGMIEKAYSVIASILKSEKINFEIIFINDGSKDKTWEKICELKECTDAIKGISFSRNFGKESAVLAGLAYAEGDCCVVLDCDLQHPPETIVEMYRLWESGYEVVNGVKINRGRESVIHKMAAQAFYKIIGSVTRLDMSNASDFKLLDRKVVDVLLKMPEHHPFFRALSSWVGFKTTTVEFEVREREIGESKWSVSSLVKYALVNIASFSTLPLQMITILGILFLLLSMILGGQTLYFYFSGQAMPGFTTVIILLLLIGSFIMIGLGIIGFYIAKIYEEVKNRPRYIVSKKVMSEQLKKGFMFK